MKFHRQEFCEALEGYNIPKPVISLLAAMADDVEEISGEIESARGYGSSVQAISARNAIFNRMATIISAYTNKPMAFDLGSDEVKLLIKYILSTVKTVAETTVGEGQSDVLMVSLVRAFENWANDFEIFKSSLSSVN